MFLGRAAGKKSSHKTHWCSGYLYMSRLCLFCTPWFRKANDIVHLNQIELPCLQYGAQRTISTCMSSEFYSILCSQSCGSALWFVSADDLTGIITLTVNHAVHKHPLTGKQIFQEQGQQHCQDWRACQLPTWCALGETTTRIVGRDNCSQVNSEYASSLFVFAECLIHTDALISRGGGAVLILRTV